MGSLAIRPLVLLFLAAAVHSSGALPEFKNAQARTHYEQAMQYGDKGLWAPAILELNRARGLEPSNPEILIQLGIAHGERREWNQALGFLRRAVAVAPASVQAHYNLALTLDRADPGKGAGTPEYRKALSLSPRHVDSLVNLAVNVGDQDAAEAKALFERAIRLQPKNAIAHLNLGLLLKKESQEAVSIAEFRQAIELDPNLREARQQLATVLMTQQHWDEVIQQCREILKRDPDDASTRYTMAQALIRSQKVDEGKKELERAQALRIRSEQQKKAQEFQAEGIRELNAGNPSNAAKVFTSALQIDASSTNHMYLGLSLAASGDLKSGMQELTRAVELEPNNARAHVNLGSVYLQAGQEYLAKTETEKALKIDPWFPEAHNNLGLILSKANKAPEAVEHFRLAADLNPQYLEAVFNMGLSLRALNRLDDALRAFRRAADLAPQNPQVQYALGMTLKDKGDLAGARAALDRAAALERPRK